MKKQLFLLGFLFLSLQGFSQIKYEAGYFIDNSGVKTECLIKNMDLRNNPSQFKYKIDESSSPQKNDINSVQEFAIVSGKKYRRYIVDIDRSLNTEMSKMSTVKEPEFEKDTLFLNVLIEGKASLYYYKDSDVYRFFFNIDNSNPIQLVYKKYTVIDKETLNKKVIENELYKSQLWKEVNCGNLPVKTIFDTDYSKKSLVKYFIKYNECREEPFKDLSKNQQRNKFNLTIRPGVRYSKLDVVRQLNDTATEEISFGSKLTFRVGIEAEYILPLYKNKFSVLVEPTFQYFKAETKVYNPTITSAQYYTLELPLGLRYYVFLNEKSKIFANALFVFDMEFNSYLAFNDRADWDLRSPINFAIGGGYNFNNQFSIEFRYGFVRNILTNYGAAKGSFRTFEINFGYSIINK